MRLFKALVVMAGVAMLASGVSAAPVVTWTVEKNAGQSLCGVDVDLYTFHAQAGEGRGIVVIDAAPSGTNPYGGIYDCPTQYAGVITGELADWEFGADPANPEHPSEGLYQVWLFGGGAPTAVNEVFGNAADALETHFFIPSGVTPEVNTMGEDNDQSCGAGTGAGWGTYLTGRLGWAGSVAPNEMDILQVAVPSGQAFYAKFQVVETGTVGEDVTAYFEACVPEPTTLVVLGLGAVAMLRRRR